MKNQDTQTFTTFRGAFRRVWQTLLVEERITAQNVAQVPDLLIQCMIASLDAGAHDVESLYVAAMEGMTLLELAEAQDGAEATDGSPTYH